MEDCKRCKEDTAWEDEQYIRSFMSLYNQRQGVILGLKQQINNSCLCPKVFGDILF